MKNFYLLYSPLLQITPQTGEQITITPQLGKQIFSVPWGHHKLLIDKCKGQPEKALFYVQQTIMNGWSRDVLLNIYSTDFYERHSKAISNFTAVLPEADNKTIGLLICKTKDNVFAQYALEATSQPLGISEYELQKLYPTKVEGTIPTIAEIESVAQDTVVKPDDEENPK